MTETCKHKNTYHPTPQPLKQTVVVLEGLLFALNTAISTVESSMYHLRIAQMNNVAATFVKAEWVAYGAISHIVGVATHMGILKVSVDQIGPVWSQLAVLGCYTLPSMINFGVNEGMLSSFIIYLAGQTPALLSELNTLYHGSDYYDLCLDESGKGADLFDNIH